LHNQSAAIMQCIIVGNPDPYGLVDTLDFLPAKSIAEMKASIAKLETEEPLQAQQSPPPMQKIITKRDTDG